MSESVEVSAVMPCLNEAQTVGLCVQKAQQSFRELGLRGEVIVADNGSTDASVSIAAQLGARVVHETTRGYGAALMRGIEAASAPIVIMGDADDSYDWLNVAPFVRQIRDGCDLVIGNRFAGGIQPGAMPVLHRYLGNPVLSALARLVYHAPVGDFHCGMRAFTKSAYQTMKLSTTGMEFATEMVANAALQGLKISQVPIRLYPDGRNRPPHLRSFHDGWRHLRFIFTYAPDYLYFLPGGAMLLAGLFLVAMLTAGPLNWHGVYIGVHFLALGSMLALTGFNVVAFGVIAKLLISRDLVNMKSHLVSWTRRHFNLERGIIPGTLLLLSGSAMDASVLWRWLANGMGAMAEGTVHLAFAATTVIAFGVDVILSSFLINMLLSTRSAAIREPSGNSSSS